MQHSLIVGFGKAGRDLHLKCLLKTHHARTTTTSEQARIGIIDPKLDICPSDLPCAIELFPDYASAMNAFGPETVVHVCTPPGCHAKVIEEGIEHGFQNIIVEKPLASNTEDLKHIGRLLESKKVKVVVIANWLSSTLTNRLMERIEKVGNGNWHSIKMIQHKSRFGYTLDNSGHQSAFDVEIPHEIALALHFSGLNAEVTAARCEDMCVNGKRIPHMGSASVTLEHSNGQLSRLCSDLMSPIRQRMIQINLDNGWRLDGYFPTDSGDSYSQLHVIDKDGEIIEQTVFPDDPLSSCLIKAYQYFAGADRPPASDYKFNHKVVTLIQHAKGMCGIQPEEKI